MQTTIDAAGRIVIPKDVRERLGLTGVREVDIREVDGRIEIEPRSAPMSLRHGPGGVAAVSAEDLPPLTDDVARETLERLRRRSPSTPAWTCERLRAEYEVIG